MAMQLCLRTTTAFIIAGQGTVGLEILEDCPDVDLVLVPVGGGGLISGVSSAIKLSGSKAKVIGVEPELANDAQQSFQRGEIVQLPAERVSSTLADGLRTQSVGPLNFEHILGASLTTSSRLRKTRFAAPCGAPLRQRASSPNPAER